MSAVDVGGWEDGPSCGLIFAEMVARAGAVQTHYRGDLFYDAIELAEMVKELRPGASLVFQWITRPCGTHVVRDDDDKSRDLAASLLAMSSGATHYRVTIAPRERHGWTATFQRVGVNV